MNQLLEHLSILDVYALVWFIVCWVGYSFVADHTPLKRYSVSTAMAIYRRQWMCQMIEREIRIYDAQLQGNLLQGMVFFSTTTILAIGGLLALLGSADQAIEFLSDLPFVGQGNRTAWEIKVLMLVLVFIYAFFKFAWAFRLANWNSILFGAAPVVDSTSEKGSRYVETATIINRLSSSNFNRGIRAYFFALAGLSWFLDTKLFIVATALVLLVLINREFRTRIVAQI